MVVRRALTDDLTALARTCADGMRIALLVGRAGVGKSTLARTVADRSGLPQLRLDLFPDDRANVHGAVRQLARVLGVSPTSDLDLVEALLAALERQGRCLLIIEDAQWMDEDSQHTIWKVLRRASALPIMLLMTSVDTIGPLAEGIALMLRTLERGRQVDVEPFGEAEVRDYVREIFGIELGAETLRRVHEATNGVPALLTSVVQQLRSAEGVDLDRALRTIVDRSRSSGLLAQQVDGAMEDASVPARAALIALALSGRLTVDQLTGVLCQQRLTDVSARHLLETGLVDIDATGALRLAHPQYPGPILSYATGADRRDCHLALARVLRGVDSLEHRAAVASAATGPDILQEVDDRLHDAYGQAEVGLAFRLARIGARVDEGYMIEVVLAALRARRPQLLRDLREDIENLRPSVTRTVALAVLEDDVAQLRTAAARLARLDPQVITDVRELLALAHASTYLAARLVAEVVSPAVPALRRLVDELTTRQVDVAELEPSWGRELTLLLLNLQMLLAGADLEHPTSARLRHLERLGDQVERSGDPELAVTAAAMRGIIHHLRGDLALARAELVRATRGTVLVSPDLRLQAESALIDIDFQRGAWDVAHQRAHRQLTTALDALRPVQWGKPFVLASLVPACRGDESIITTSPVTDSLVTADHVSRAAKGHWTAWRDFALGDPPGRAGMALDTLAGTGRGCGPGAYLLIVLRVRDHLAAGSRNRACEALSAFADTDFDPHAIAYARHHVAALLAADVEDQETAAREFSVAAEEYTAYATANAEAAPRLYGAVLAEDWARLTSGEATPALTALLAEAVHVTAFGGAAHWHDRLVALHAQVQPGAPLPEGSAGDPLAALTAREREVVALAAGGRSNRDISRALFVTVRTAEYHVHNALTKLGLSSRNQLSELIGEGRDDVDAFPASGTTSVSLPTASA